MFAINNLFTIGDISKLKNITIDALRHYDKIDLLKPEYIDKNTNYRYYSSSQFFKMDLIKFCKTLDIPLTQIKDLIKTSDQETFVEFLKNQRNEANLKIKEYTHIISHIDNIINRVDEYNISKKEKDFYYKYLPERNIVFLDYSGSPSGEESSVAHSKLYNSIINSNFHISYNGGFIYSFDEKNIYTKCIFECVYESTNALNIANKILPSGTYLCKSYCDDEYEDASNKLLKEIYKRKINSNYIINTYLLDGEFHSNYSLSELQVFVSDSNLVL